MRAIPPCNYRAVRDPVWIQYTILSATSIVGLFIHCHLFFSLILTQSSFELSKTRVERDVYAILQLLFLLSLLCAECITMETQLIKIKEIEKY